MLDFAPWTLVLMGLALLAGVSVMLAMIVRRAGVPGGAAGAALTAGIVAGVLVGPMVLGRMWTPLHEAMFVGAVKQTAAVRDVVAENDRQMHALMASGVTPTAVAEQRDIYDRVMGPLLANRTKALDAHRERWTLAIAAVAGLYLYLATILAMPVGAARWRRLGGTLVMTSARPLIAGWCAVVMAGAPVAATAGMLLGWSWPACAALGLVFAIPGLTATLAPTIALVCAGGLFASFVVAGVIGWSLGFTIAIAGVFLALMTVLGVENPALRRLRPPARGLVFGVMLPLLAALSCARADVYHLTNERAFWASVIIGVLWSSDGRWLAARVALWMSRSRRAPRVPQAWTHAALSVDAGASGMQVCTALLLLSPSLLPMEVAAGAVIGAAVMEFTREIRRPIAARMDGVRG